MYCNKCGKKVNEKAVFCPNCGNKIKEYSAAGLEEREKELFNDSQYNKEKIMMIKKLRDVLELIEIKKMINEDVIENKDIEENMTLDAFDEFLKKKVDEEEKYDTYEIIVGFIVAIIGTVYYVRNGNEILYSILGSLVLAGIASAIFVTPIIKSMKKNSNCLSAKEKYDKYTTLKQTMEPNVAFQLVELEFNKSENKHGVLYYLLCVLSIILIFALC